MKFFKLILLTSVIFPQILFAESNSTTKVYQKGLNQTISYSCDKLATCSLTYDVKRYPVIADLNYLLITLNSVREPSQFKDWQLKSCEIGRSEGLILKGTIFEPIQTQIYKAVCQAKNSEDALTSISILFEEAHTYCVQDTYRMQAQGPRRTHSKVFEGYLVKGPDDEVEKLRKVVDG